MSNQPPARFERYILGMNVRLREGVPKRFSVSVSPFVLARPLRFMANVPRSGIVLITSLKIAGNPVFVGEFDAWQFTTLSMGFIEPPCFSPLNPLKLLSVYRGGGIWTFYTKYFKYFKYPKRLWALLEMPYSRK